MTQPMDCPGTVRSHVWLYRFRVRVMNLSARANAAYQNDYHHKLRGRLWDALDGTEYDDRHDNGEPPGSAYSNPMSANPVRAGQLKPGRHDHTTVSIRSTGITE